MRHSLGLHFADSPQTRLIFVQLSCVVFGAIIHLLAPPFPSWVLRLAYRCGTESLSGHAVKAMGRRGPGVEANLRTLMTALEKEKRPRTIHALKSVGPSDPRVLRTLIVLLDDSHSKVRNAAAFELGSIALSQEERKPINAIPRLISVLQDKDVEVRRTAAWALGKFGADGHAAVRPLAESLNDKDWTVRKEAACAIGLIGPAAKAAAPALVAAIKDFNKQAHVDGRSLTYACAISALGGIGPTAASSIPLLIAIVRAEESTGRYDAIEALGKMGNAASAAVPALLAVLRETPSFDSEGQIIAATVALAQIGAYNNEVERTLVSLKRHPRVGGYAGRALEKLRLRP